MQDEGKKGKAVKDPNKPKRAPNVFFVFMVSVVLNLVFVGWFLPGVSAARSSNRRTPRTSSSRLSAKQLMRGGRA
ncbi:hypothetical protein ZWY2020_014586 [Hordeum vulgare]|nr:hypothetical protein ZWY2020_014586 [Hordeum vulgare]